MTCFRHYDVLAKPVVEWRRLPSFPAKMTLVPVVVLVVESSSSE